jgi:hypothetical protein
VAAASLKDDRRLETGEDGCPKIRGVENHPFSGNLSASGNIFD